MRLTTIKTPGGTTITVAPGREHVYALLALVGLPVGAMLAAFGYPALFLSMPLGFLAVLSFLKEPRSKIDLATQTLTLSRRSGWLMRRSVSTIRCSAVRKLCIERYRSGFDWERVVLQIDGEDLTLGTTSNSETIVALGRVVGLEPQEVREWELDTSGPITAMKLFKIGRRHKKASCLTIDKPNDRLTLDNRVVRLSKIKGIWLQWINYEGLSRVCAVGVVVLLGERTALARLFNLKDQTDLELTRGLRETQMRELAATLAQVFGVPFEERPERTEWGTW